MRRNHPAALAPLLLALLLPACASQAPRPESAPAPAVAAAPAADELSPLDRAGIFVHHARTGDIESLRQELAAGADLDARDSLDQTALIAAVSQNHREVVALLLERGADPRRTDNAGWAPLHYAAYFSTTHERLKQLLDAGAPINAQNDRGITALYFATALGHEEQVRYLLDHGADRELAARSGYTPLKVAKLRGLDGIAALLEQVPVASAAKPR